MRSIFDTSRVLCWLFVAVVLTALLWRPATAQSPDTTVGRGSLARLSISAGVDHQWSAADVASSPEPLGWVAVVGLGWKLGPTVAAVGAVRVPILDDADGPLEYSFGLRKTLFRDGRFTWGL